MSETLGEYIKNEYTMGALFLFVTLYITQCQIKLPQIIESLFENDVFKIIYLTLLLMIPFKTAPHVAVTMAIIFIIVLKALLK